MVVVRPARIEDVAPLLALTHKETFGLTSLPREERILRKRVRESLHSFQLEVESPGGELYVFVMEDMKTGTVIGTSSIVSKVGGFQPFYTYKIETSVHECPSLGIRKEIPILRLVTEFSGPSEIGGLLLDPAHRKHGNGRLLSLFRFLFMSQYPERFEPNVIAEMRGVLDSQGNSPFWDAVGRHFFDMDYPTADLLSALDKRFIADLMPTCPIYVPLLPPEAQEVIGKVHEQTIPALKMLEEEGFRFVDMVDIFEAGPVVSCPLERVRIVQESRVAAVSKIEKASPEVVPFHIVAASKDEFRACKGTARMNGDGGVVIDEDVARALNVQPGDQVRFAPLQPSRKEREQP